MSCIAIVLLISGLLVGMLDPAIADVQSSPGGTLSTSKPVPLPPDESSATDGASLAPGIHRLSAGKSGDRAPETEQVIFAIDDSASMTETAFDPTDPRASRWQVLQQAYPQWLERLGPDVLVGALSVGGPCGAPPAIRLPVGSERARVTSAVQAARPSGQTNLNASLSAIPALFIPGARGGKRVIVLSDGLNTCPPMGSTCDIARALHAQGIVIDVVAWLTDPQMRDELACMASATGGTFTAPQTLEEWVNIPLPTLNPWRYVVLVLGALTLLLASQILYRHLYHVLAWSSGEAALAAGILLGAGALLLYLVLFTGTAMLAALMGMVLLVATAAVVRRKTESFGSGPAGSLWSYLLLLFPAVLMLQAPAALGASVPQTCARVAHGPPRHHHILALDASGSVVRQFSQMKSLLACYAEMYALPGEQVSVLTFGRDEMGSVAPLQTFTVPEAGATATINALLDDIEIQNPRHTHTYFRPLADYLGQFLKTVRLDPVVLVISDGKSDALDKRGGRIQFRELPFEALATRGVYSAPGVTNWKVAIQGGNGLDLTTLFRRPLPTREGAQATGQMLTPAVSPCLIDPPLLVETDERLLLTPGWNPFDSRRTGVLSIRVRNQCVARFRSFAVELRRGDQSFRVGEVRNVLVDETPSTFAFTISQPAAQPGSTEAALQLVLNQGATERVVYPVRPVITIEELSYWSTFGVYWGGAAVLLLLLSSLAVLAVRRHHQHEQRRPEMVKVLGGHGVPLYLHRTATLGGEGCDIALPGVPADAVLGFVEWTGVRGQLTVRPADGVRMKINSIETPEAINYPLGQALQFCLDNRTEVSATLYPASAREIGLGPSSLVAAGAGSAGTVSGPGMPRGQALFDATATPGAENRADDAYI